MLIFSILKIMKKFNLLCLFSILFFPCTSQDYNAGQKFNEKLEYSRMGLYFAPAVNFIQTDSDVETNSNIGVVYGYALEMSLNKNHYLESGFSISYKGGDITQTIVTETPNTDGSTTTNSQQITNDYKVEYITVPIFIKMRSREVGYFHYFARIGPSMNFKIKDLITASGDNARRISVDLSIFLGAEYSLGGKTAIASSLFFTNNITNSITNKNMKALFHQLGIRLGFLF
tara:strand:- start:2399 stop:3088 length:690 start_codon:yes stop_codon:yes gene_type:complete